MDEFISELQLVRSTSHHIDMILGASLLNKVAYKMTSKENEEIINQVQDLLNKGLEREILSPCVVLTLLSPKKNGGWQMCIDSRAINKINVRCIFPLPKMDDLMDCLSGAKYFPKLGLKSGYHHIRVREGDEWNTSFRTNDGLYASMVMPFRLINSPSTFMRLMNEVHKKIVG